VAVAVDAGVQQQGGLDDLLSRALIVRASAVTKVNCPASSRRRCRNAATCSSRSWAVRETCDMDSESITSVLTSLSSRRVDTPAR